MPTYDLGGELTGWDLEGFHSGGDTELWKRLGAHTTTVYDHDTKTRIPGVRFAVWAPNAQRVQVIGDFNYWSGDDMVRIPGSGVWSRFIEERGTGTLYKFRIQGADGEWREKVDPMARFCESAPKTAAIVYESQYVWSDDEWMAKRAAAKHHQEPISIYEVHVGGWRRGKTYLELADELVEYVTWQGYTHVEFMPLAEHPFEPSWGYQVTGYFAPTSRFGRPDELRYLIDRLHQAGIGVIMDWVPGHFPKDEWALGRFDGTALYEHEDPRQGEHMDWGTYIFNYGRSEVKSFLVSNALYWVSEMHIDALRVDAVASMLYLDYSRKDGEWVPNQFGGNENLEAIDFLRRMNHLVGTQRPEAITLAEESTAFPAVSRPPSPDLQGGGLGFHYKWNMGWMNDLLAYLARDPVHRKHHHDQLRFSLAYAFSENFVLPLSHDEVVHGKGSLLAKMPGDVWQKFANLRLLYGYMWAHPGKKLLFMGCEFAPWSEWNADASLPWEMLGHAPHAGMQRLVRDLNRVLRSHPALYEQDTASEGFRWISHDDAAHSVLVFERRARDGRSVVVACNFTPVAREQWRIGIPSAGTWRELINTDDAMYGGSGVTNGALQGEAVPWQGEAQSLVLRLPPLGVLMLVRAD